ncbi:NAD-dependent epimerase/dehydratase family protein [Anaerolineales bacterium HSG6]|nr:NAD-dependent epimerase/dehydratase family protein [Anaerolineales bacterium HSG6]
MTKILVTGGTGFLGGALVRRLQNMPVSITVVGRNRSVGEVLTQQGVRFIQADLADRAAMERACRNQDIVFHCGALSVPWGRRADFYSANLIGTQNVIHGCFTHKIKRLIHVSTPAIYFNYQNRLNVAEYDRLPAKPVNAYAETKRLAEQAINRAYQHGLPVITLRPRAIFGPGDQAIFPRLIRAIKSGRLRIIGGGQAQTDLTYIENVVSALLLAQTSPPETLGRAYNITNGQPVSMWHMITQICQRLGYPPPRRHVPFRVAYYGAGLLETAHHIFMPHREPMVTQYGVGLLGRTITLDIRAAQRDLDYQPRVSMADGLEHFLTWWVKNQNLLQESQTQPVET